MIPKKIHYCWFGGSPLPYDAKKNIESWKHFCPEFEIKEWNESNFDITSNKYVEEAYENKKWAFITDYVRLYALVSEGGIYMDTDVEIIKPLDAYIGHKAFSGFETDTDIPTGIMGCEKGFKLFEEFLHNYDNRHFIKKDGQADLTSNVYAITQICLKHGLVRNNTFQNIEGFALYPKDYFCPKDHRTGKIHCTENTVAIHHFAGSWVTGKNRKWLELEKKIRKADWKSINIVLDSRMWDVIKKIYINGLRSNIKRLKEKIFR